MTEIYDIYVAGEGEAWDFDMYNKEHREEVYKACEKI